MGLVLLFGFFYLVALTAFNAGVIVFAGTTVFYNSMRWIVRVGVALGVFVVVVLVAWWGLSAFASQSVGAPVASDFFDLVTVIKVLFIAFHTLALFAIARTIVWLWRKRPVGYRSVLKWIAVPCAFIGAGLTCFTLVAVMNIMTFGPLDRTRDMMEHPERVNQGN